DGRLHRLSPPVGPDGLLGERRRHQPERDGAVPRPMACAVPTVRAGDQRQHLVAVLLAAHAHHSGRDHRAHHAAPVPRHPARRHVAAVVAGSRRGRGRGGAVDAAHRADAPGAARRHGRQGLMAEEKPSPIEERRAGFARYKKDVKERGKPFYPYAMFHDTVMSLVVVSVIVGLAVIWKYTTPGDHTSTQPGWLGPLYTDRADPGTTNFVPRPDWYFYFLFYLLRIFKWPESVILGTVGIPTILLVIMFALPFLDLRRERRLLRRPV